MALTYTQYVTDLANLMIVPTSDPNFQTMIPNALDYAELRIQRDLDLLDNTVRDTSGTLTPGSISFTLPTTNGTFIVIDQMNVITPAGTSVADNGTRNPLTKCSAELIYSLWPNSNGSTVPKYFAPIDQDVMIVAPFPNQGYNVEVVGTQRFRSLYLSQTTSPISVFFPDMLIAVSMVFASGFQQNYGAAGVDNPEQAMNWEAQYRGLLKSAQTEEARKRFIIGDTTPSTG